MARTALAALGVLMSLGWAVLFVEAPGVALELLVLASPVVVTLWLIVMLSGPGPHRRAKAAAGAARRVVPAALSPCEQETGRSRAPRAEVLRRDGGACRLCGAPRAMTVAAERPARRDDDDPLRRYISLCDGCAATTSLPLLAARAADAGA